MNQAWAQMIIWREAPLKGFSHNLYDEYLGRNAKG
jgi:hypothetical protein